MPLPVWECPRRRDTPNPTFLVLQSSLEKEEGHCQYTCGFASVDNEFNPDPGLISVEHKPQPWILKKRMEGISDWSFAALHGPATLFMEERRELYLYDRVHAQISSDFIFTCSSVSLFFQHHNLLLCFPVALFGPEIRRACLVESFTESR